MYISYILFDMILDTPVTVQVDVAGLTTEFIEVRDHLEFDICFSTYITNCLNFII